MASDPSTQPSFTPWRKWNIGLHVAAVLVLVLAVVVMLNYLSRDFYHRFNASSRTQLQLSPLTLKLLSSITNRIQVTLYYDQTDPMYSTVADLLDLYHQADPRLTVETVDYVRDPGAAQKIKSAYKLGGATDKNLVIFDADGRVKMIEGNVLAEYSLESVPDATENTVRRKPTVFRGELLFTSILYALGNPKQLKACILQGHGEHGIRNPEERLGYAKFVALLQQNYLHVEPLSLAGTNAIPADCNLLVIAGPNAPFEDAELDKIAQYLAQGGRLFLLFNADSVQNRTGLERLCNAWGFAVGNFVIQDLENSSTGDDVVISAYSRHALVNPLYQYALKLTRPRPVGKLNAKLPLADPPKAEELFFTGPNATVEGTKRTPQRYPVGAAVEKGAIKGVITERGSTRIVVVGDSLFLTNQQIETAANRDFASWAVNWLLERTELLQGIIPRPVTSYRLVMTRQQLEIARWILLVAMPGAILVVGGLVWFRRRK